MSDYKWNRVFAGAKRRAIVFRRRVPRPWKLLLSTSFIRTELWVGRRIVTMKIPSRKRRVLVQSAVTFGPMASGVRYDV